MVSGSKPPANCKKMSRFLNFKNTCRFKYWRACKLDKTTGSCDKRQREKKICLITYGAGNKDM
jgi:hypothetical protein